MLEMILYGVAIMYTPGPVNIVALNMGMTQKLRDSAKYCTGVSLAMFVLFVVFGYTGERIVKKEYLIYISIAGGLYILWLAYKVLKSKVDIKSEQGSSRLTLKNGFLMQLFNPKAIVAVLPIATIHFVVNGIMGINILWMSMIFAIIVFFAPFSYGIIGALLSRFVTAPKVLNLFNKLMGLLLIYVAFSILYDHVYLVLKGVNAY
jgi:threonine/homoserine/homoserine lactone efflux protein